MTERQGGLTLVFPGQGAQFVGMATGLLEGSERARDLFAAADDLLALPLTRIIQEGPAELLDDTAVTQPAILTVSVALWREIEAHCEEAPSVACVAGHSLGELSALTVAGAWSFEEGLRLVRRRGEAMAAAGQTAPGGMGVILGLNDDEVQGILDEVRGSQPGVWVANLNSPGQVVISGLEQPVQMALELAQARGAKRALPLAVSVAAHTPLMQAANEALAEALERIAMQAPWAPVVCNAWARPISDPQEIKQALLAQLTHPVQWTASVERMAGMGVQAALEIGPKAVLGALIRRIAPDMARLAVTDLAEARDLALEEFTP